VGIVMEGTLKILMPSKGRETERRRISESTAVSNERSVHKDR